MYDYKDMAERAHFEATHKKIDGGPGSWPKKSGGEKRREKHMLDPTLRRLKKQLYEAKSTGGFSGFLSPGDAENVIKKAEKRVSEKIKSSRFKRHR